MEEAQTGQEAFPQIVVCICLEWYTNALDHKLCLIHHEMDSYGGDYSDDDGADDGADDNGGGATQDEIILIISILSA